MQMGSAGEATALAAPSQTPQVVSHQRVPRSLVWPAMLALLFVTGVAFWLRWRFVQYVDLSVDEFTSLWAARRTLETGAPRMLSGAYYLRGLLLSYHIAGLAEVAGLSRLVARAPGLAYGVAAVPLLYCLGFRGWNARVGLLAAVGLAVLPEAVVASGKIRFYSLALFYATLAFWAHYESLEGGANSRRSLQWLTAIGSALAFAAALFSYEGAVLLYPVILVGALWWRGWRWLLHPPVLVAQLIFVAAIAARFGMETLGAHSYLLSMQEGKAIFAPFMETLGRVRPLAETFGPWRRLFWSLGCLVAISTATVALARNHWRLADLAKPQRAAVVYILPVLAFVAALILVVGDDYGVERQLLIVQPLWLLVGAAGLIWCVERALRGEAMRWLATVAIAVGLGSLLIPYSLRAAEHVEEGYEVALTWLAAEVDPGDVTLSAQPAACAVTLPEPCTYYMRSEDYQAYVLERKGRTVDLWSGAPLLSTTEQLEEVVKSGQRTWIVIDEQRLGRRHSTDFIELVAREFEPRFGHLGVWVLEADGWKEPRDYAVLRQYDPAVEMGPLELESLARGVPTPGHGMPVRLIWHVDGGAQEQVNTSLQLVAADGSRVTQDDGPPADGLISTMAGPRVALPDAKAILLPDAMSSGRYRLEVSTYEALTDHFLAGPIAVEWFWIGPKPQPLASLATPVAWESGLRLVGMDLPDNPVQEGAALDVRLEWNAAQPISQDYVFFVQMLDDEGRLVAQADHEPESGFYPTSAWEVGESVQDSYTLDIPSDLEAGKYRLITGMYGRDTQERASLMGEGDAYVLGEIMVGESDAASGFAWPAGAASAAAAEGRNGLAQAGS